MNKTDFLAQLHEFGDQFEQAITGDLKWVLIAVIALTLGAVYAASVGQVRAEEVDDAQW